MVEWTHWHNEPLLVAALVTVAWAYALAIGPWRHRLDAGAGPIRGQVARFSAGLVVFYLAVGSPLDQIGERFLFSAHMLQHMIIVYASAPLVLSGVPHWLIDAPLSTRGVRVAARALLAPATAAVVYALIVSLWHIPAAYDHALRVKIVHVAQHLMFFAAAIVFWWPLASPSRILPRCTPGVQVLYVFGAGILQFPLVAFLNFSREVLYPTYEFAPRLVAMTPREDQVAGGALMGVGGMFVALGLIARAFYQWSRQSPATDPAEGRTASSS